jgi:predicted unusual protein kinase regulating ubiquinone biosynthesis (AarF/ABC1/UbiB family)
VQTKSKPVIVPWNGDMPPASRTPKNGDRVVVDAGRLRPPTGNGNILVPLPRTNRYPLSQESIDATRQTGRRPRRPWPLPKRQREAEVFKAPISLILRRLLIWFQALGYYAYLWLSDRVNGRGEPQHAGERLRATVEKIGGTFVKLGQQLSTRIDILPFETCREFSKLLDDMAAFPIEEAIATVERGIGRPLGEVFAHFDPQPLGSMSIGCVYRAELANGEAVAVKVRRPGIGPLFAADLAALDLFCRAAEMLTLIRPGFTRALRTELRTMLLEELDFQAEARYQELFRNQAKRDAQDVTAPRVYYEYSNREVLVTEYVRGVWLQDLIAAKESDDRGALDYLASMNVTPRRVARRLLRTFYWSTFETLFYHADPHPGNILVQPDGKLVFTNFGACGPTTHKNRRNYAELFRRQARRDLDGMVQVFGNILSPLPRTDVHNLLKAAEAKVARWQYGFDSKHAEWWERGSAGLWIGIMEMAREHRIPVSIETVRFFRASLLCDTTAARLYDKINGPRELARYQREARRRLQARAQRRWSREVNVGQLLVEIDRVSDLAGRLVYKLQDLSDQPATSFLSTLNKGAFAVSSTLRLTFLVGLFTATAAGISTLTEQLDGGAFWALTQKPWYWAVIVLLALRSYRVVQFRLADVDE